MSAVFCAFNITRDMKNFDQILTILALFNKIEIGTKFISTSPVIETAY